MSNQNNLHIAQMEYDEIMNAYGVTLDQGGAVNVKN